MAVPCAPRLALGSGQRCPQRVQCGWSSLPQQAAQSLGPTYHSCYVCYPLSAGALLNNPIRRRTSCQDRARLVLAASSAEVTSVVSLPGNVFQLYRQVEGADLPEAVVPLEAEILTSIAQVSQEEWNACAVGSGEVNPFVLWEFFTALEESKSAVAAEGWRPQHVLLRHAASRMVLAACPLYLKTHSSGEYVFDHSWAHMAMYAGQRYYPKLQCCVPFTPVTGPRVLIRSGVDPKPIRGLMAKALMSVAEEFKVSSLHMTFNTRDEWEQLGDYGFLRRNGIQYHWHNSAVTFPVNSAAESPGFSPYESFDDFLLNLKQSKRKAIRQERKSVSKENLRLRRLSGQELTAEVWDQFYCFYRNTTDHKWGQAYLTREFFHRLGDSMADRVVLAAAEDPHGGGLVAGALNLLGSHALFGRNWGCVPGCWIKHLHFELCYYQAIEAAIEMGLERVEAGAQGEHKIQRGYLPQLTYSSHVILDSQLCGIIDASLQRDRAVTNYSLQMLQQEASPYKS